MSVQHPVVAVTGSSGAGTTSVTKTFQHIFRREGITPAIVEGDTFHRYDRKEMKLAMAAAERTRTTTSSHFGPEANLLRELEKLFRGTARRAPASPASTCTTTTKPRPTARSRAPSRPGRICSRAATCCSTRDCTAPRSPTPSTSSSTPTCWSAWCRSSTWSGSRRCTGTRRPAGTPPRPSPTRSCAGCRTTCNYICPQFSRTDINFQRVPTVDTSDPFTARYIPSADESFLIIRFANPRGIDFPYLLSMLHDSFMSRPNIIVVPGGKMELSMQLIFTPLILRLMEKKRQLAS